MSGFQVFLYGPFADRALLQALIGAMEGKATPASLGGFSLRAGALKGAATVAPQEGAEVSGLVLSGLSDTARSTLDSFLQTHGAIIQQLPVRIADHDHQVQTPVLPAPRDAPWDQKLWQDVWAPIWRASVPEIRSLQSTLSPKQLAARLPVIWSRASAQLAVQTEPRLADSGLDLGDVTIHSRQRVHSNFFAVDEITLSHARFDGDQGPVLEREVFVAADAVTVLPYDPLRDVVLLVEQIRMGPLARGDRFPWVMEPVAGRIEPGDSPESTARKEAMEEAGLADRKSVV